VHLLADRGPVMPHSHAPSLEIDGFDVHLSELHVPGAAERPDGVENVACLHSARRRFGQHWREQEEVLVADQGDVHGEKPGAAPGQLQRRRDSGEPTADDHDPGSQRR